MAESLKIQQARGLIARVPELNTIREALWPWTGVAFLDPDQVCDIMKRGGRTWNETSQMWLEPVGDAEVRKAEPEIVPWITKDMAVQFSEALKLITSDPDLEDLQRKAIRSGQVVNVKRILADGGYLWSGTKWVKEDPQKADRIEKEYQESYKSAVDALNGAIDLSAAQVMNSMGYEVKEPAPQKQFQPGVYQVQTESIDGVVHFDNFEDAEDFIKDQRGMGYKADTIKIPVTPVHRAPIPGDPGFSSAAWEAEMAAAPEKPIRPTMIKAEPPKDFGNFRKVRFEPVERYLVSPDRSQRKFGDGSTARKAIWHDEDNIVASRKLQVREDGLTDNTKVLYAPRPTEPEAAKWYDRFMETRTLFAKALNSMDEKDRAVKGIQGTMQTLRQANDGLRDENIRLRLSEVHLNKIMREIPDCPAHGADCYPHAIEWIIEHRDNDLAPVRKGTRIIGETSLRMALAAAKGLVAILQEVLDNAR